MDEQRRHGSKLDLKEWMIYRKVESRWSKISESMHSHMKTQHAIEVGG